MVDVHSSLPIEGVGMNEKVNIELFLRMIMEFIKAVVVNHMHNLILE